MKRLLPLFALCAFALPAAATVYRPGLWFVQTTASDDVGAGVAGRADKVPCQGAFMEYTETYQTNIAERGNYNGGTSFFRSGTNAYTGAVSTWELKTGFGYAGEFFVEKGRSYTFSENHGRFIKILLDGSELLDGGAWFGMANATYTAPETGWIPIEIRAGCNFGADVMAGPLLNSFGTGFNTNGLVYAAATWGAAPWQRILDPGDCSLLRIASPDADCVSLDSVTASGSDLALSVSFADVPSAGRLTAFWGGSNGGDLPRNWAHATDLGTVAAGTSESGVAYAVPGAAGAAFVALRLQNADYAAGPYTQFTAAAPVPRATPTFDLFCTEIGYTSLVFRAVVAAVGTGASAVPSAAVQIATDGAFANVVKTLPLPISAPGEEVLSTAGLVSNTVYYARVAGTNDLGATGFSAAVGPVRTLLPTASTSTIAALEPGLGALNAAVTVTDWGADSHGATVRLEASAHYDFGVLAGVSPEVDATLGVATNLMVVGLLENSEYYLRARIVNSWGITEYRKVDGVLTTRGKPFEGTPLVWETAADGTLSVHERLLDNEFTGEAELFLDGVSKGVRPFPASPCRISFTGVPMPQYPASARVVVSVVVSGRPYSAEWSDTVVPGSACYLERKWVYDPSAKTLTWTDGYPSENVVKNVTANGNELTIGNNQNQTNPLGINLDFSPGVEGGYEIVKIAAGAFVGYNGSCLTNIVFPSSLREVGRAAFEQCKTLRGLRMNEGLVDLGTGANNNNCFLGCTNLQSIGDFPSTLEIVGDAIFKSCSSLQGDVVWPRKARIVPNGAFSGTAIRSFKAEYGVTDFGTVTNGDGRVTGGNNSIRTIDLPVTLEYVSGRMFADASASKGLSADVWYRGFPKRGWSVGLWWNMQGKNMITNWFEFHHRDEFRAYAETNTLYHIVLPATYHGSGTFENQVVRWWKDPDQYPPSVMILR
ncbi:MAG: leucine-rich repeat domain-containing protein [Kiritimatiellae bacterium]|nr:leucine-rich repeat domain-containing protein [Kiritimatiellia bacterium]